MKEEYEWRFCPCCKERIFKNEVEGDTIRTINDTAYCIDCANDKFKQNELKCPDEFGIYNKMIVLSFPDHMYTVNGGYYTSKDSCSIDICMVDEVQYLWQKGIVTTGCCCGHGITDAMVNVADCSIQKMIQLGYQQSEENDYTFLAKSKHKRKEH